VFFILAPILSAILVFVGFLILPFRWVFKFIIDKFKRLLD
jgi:poly-D-alanine transfer protein DltD